MDKETLVLVIAQNGLGTCEAFLNAAVVKLRKQLDKAKTDEEKAKIQKDIDKKQKLARALNAADVGVKDYMGSSPF